jgi:hypothetical protein
VESNVIVDSEIYVVIVFNIKIRRFSLSEVLIQYDVRACVCAFSSKKGVSSIDNAVGVFLDSFERN